MGAWLDKRRESKRVAARKYRRGRYAMAWASSTIGKHQKKGYRILFTARELATKLEQTPLCESCDCELRCTIDGSNCGPQPNSPTLDRLKQTKKTLSLKDIEINCLCCNSGKNTGTKREWIERCRRVARKHT